MDVESEGMKRKEKGEDKERKGQGEVDSMTGRGEVQDQGGMCIGFLENYGPLRLTPSQP